MKPCYSMSSNSVFGLVRKNAVLVVLLLGVGLTSFPSQTNASLSSSPFQNEYAHYVVSKEKKARCTNLRSLYGLGNVHYEPPANPLLAHSGPSNACDGDDQQQPKTNAVPASQAVLDPQASPSADTQQQANQESFLVAALASNNPNEKVSELTALLPVSGATHAGALDVNHENLVLHEDSDHIGIFQGEFNKTTATKCGLGAFMGKAFPGMYVGNWSLNFKHGYGFNLRCCGKRFIAEGYEWNQGVPIRKWIMPSTLRDAISALDVCAFKGIKTLVELLSKVPRSHVMEQLTAGPTSILDENDNYRIVIDGDGRQLEILGGKQDDNTSLVPSAMKDESPHCRFCVTALGSNRYVIFPSHSLCHALAPADVPATEGSSIVQVKYVEGDERFNWSVERNNSDTFTIRHEQTGLVMTASEPGTFKMSLSKYSSLPTQSFVFDKYSTPSLSSKDPSKALHEGNIYMVQNVGQKTYWARKGKGTTTNTKLSSEPLMKDVNYNHYLFKATQAQLKGPATVWQFDTVGIGKELRLDIPGANTSENIEPMFWTPHTNANQQYELVPVDGKPGVFMVKCVHSGLFLTTQCSGVVSQRKKNESNPDQWYQFFEGKQSAQLVDGKKYNIQSKNMSAMLQSLNGNVQQVKGSSMTIGSGQSDETFKWIARHLGNDTYAFQPVNNTSMALATVSDKGTVALIKYDAANSWCRWKCSRMEDFGLFTLVNEATGLNLTSNIEDGKLVTSKATGGNNQEFSITDSN